jgi:uncharacterized membrane protein YgcG
MYLTLLLPLLAAGGPVQPAAAIADDPPIRIWINNDGRFLRGDRAKVHVRTEDDGYLIVLNADADGHLRVLFPLDPTDDNFVRGGKKYEVEGRGGRDAFDVGDRSGRGSVYAAVSRSPFRFDEFVLSDHWDYKALEPRTLAEDPEPELTELVRRMAGGSFDYDVMSYYVVDRVVYADDYSYSRPHYGGFYYDDFGCGYYRSCGSGLSVSLFFGRPFYRRSYYGPYHYAYDPFYDPFFYDPWYYRPYYHRPVYYYPRGYWGYPYHYRNVGYYDRWNRSYAPYRFRDRTLANADYRDRRYTFGRAVNTVYTPPVSRFSQPDNASPIRRAVDRQDGERPEATVARRTSSRTSAGEGRRNESTSIEARRARPAEAPRAVPDVRGRRENLPVDASPRRASADRSGREAAPAREARPAPEARSSGRSEQSPPREARPEPRSSDRGSSGGERAERAPSSSSGASWSGGGGDRSGGRSGGSPSSGGGRRR